MSWDLPEQYYSCRMNELMVPWIYATQCRSAVALADLGYGCLSHPLSLVIHIFPYLRSTYLTCYQADLIIPSTPYFSTSYRLLVGLTTDIATALVQSDGPSLEG